MTIGACLDESIHRLVQADINTARLDALVLLEDVTGRDRAWLLAHPDEKIYTEALGKLKKLISRREQHEPMAYLRGKTEFYGREFLLDKHVLEPRPESETMIDLLKNLPGLDGRPTIADMGAGSGALGITAALELPGSIVELFDIDEDALKVAKMNVDLFTLDMSAEKSDLLSTTNNNYRVLLCNLPYVPDDFQINPAAMREPKIAIFGGPDGLDLYRKLFKQLQNRRSKPLYILCEALPPQHEKLVKIANAAGYTNYQQEDFIVVFKYKN